MPLCTKKATNNNTILQYLNGMHNRYGYNTKHLTAIYMFQQR